MKTILRIVAILIVASIVAGGFYLAVNATSLSTGSTTEAGQLSAMTIADGQSFQPRERPEGGEQGGSITQGLTGVLVTLARLAVITGVVLLLERAFRLISPRKFKFAQRWYPNKIKLEGAPGGKSGNLPSNFRLSEYSKRRNP